MKLPAMKLFCSMLLMGLIASGGLHAATTFNITTNTNWTAIAGGPPTNADTINVTNGATLILDTNGSVKDINLGDGTTNGTLTIGDGTARTLTVAGNLNITSTGAVGVDNSNTTETLNIAGNIVVDGSLNFDLNNNTRCNTIFNGTTQQISGAGATCKFNNITVNALATVTLARNIVVGNATAGQGNITVSGKLDLSSFTADRATTSTSTLTVNSGGELDIGGTNSLPNNYNTYSFNAASTEVFNGTTQTVDSVTYGNLTIGGSGTKTAGGNLTIAGDLAIQAGTLDIGTNTANRSAAGGTLSISAGASLLLAGAFPTNYSTVTLNATSTVNYDGTGSQTVVAQNYGNLTLSGARTGANNVTLANAGTIGVAGTLSLTATFGTGNYVTTNSTVNFNGAAQSVPAFPGAVTYNNLTLSGSGTKTGAATITVGGTLTNSNAITFSGMTTLNLNGATASTNGTGTISAGTLNVNAGGGLLANNGTVTVTDLIGAGTFTQNNGSALNVAGSATITTLNAATNSNTVDYNGTGAQSIKAGNYFNLTISGDKGTNTVTLPAASVGVAGAFSPTATNVTYSVTGNTIDYNGAAQSVALFAYNNLTLSNSGVKTFAAGTTSIAGALTFGGTATADATTNATVIDYNGTGAQTITAMNYNDLTISNARAGAANITLANAGTIGVAGNFNATATFGTGNYVVTGSTINFNGAAQNISAFGFNNLTLSGSGTKTGAATIDVGGTLTNSNGITFSGMTTLNLNGGTASTNGTGTISASTVNVNAAGGSLANSGTVTVTDLIGAGTFTQNNGGTLNIAGSATIATLNASTNSNTVDYNGTGAQSIVAANYFNLTISGDKGANTVTLPAASVGVAGTFSPTATNVTYATAGNTIDYNGGGAQNIALFAYNNLTLSNAGTKTFTAGTTGIAGALTITGATADATTNATTIDYNGNGAQTVTGMNYNNLTISGTRGANNVTLDNATTIGVAGVLDPSTVSFTTGSIVVTGSTVNFNGAAQSVPVLGTGYNNLTLSGSGTKTYTTVDVGGVLTNNNGIAFNGTTLNLNGAVTSTNGTGTISANTLNVNNAGGTLTNSGTVNASVDLTGTGTFTQNNGSLLRVSGTATITTLTANALTNTVDYNAGGNQTIKGTNYDNLQVSTSGTKTAGGNVGIAGTLSFSGTATYDGTGFTTTFNGAGAQNIPGTGATYDTLATGGSGTKTVTSNVTTTSITVNNGTTLDNGGFTINGTGTLLVTATGTLQLGGTTSFPTGYATVTLTAGSTVIFGGTAQTVDTTQAYSNVTMAGSGTKTASAALTVGNALTVNSGVTFSGTALTLNGAGTNNGTITLTGTLDGTGSLTQGGTPSVLTVGGDITISTLDASTNANTVNYNGAGAQSVKATTYRTLNFSGGNTKTAAAGVTVSTAMTNANGTTFSGTTLTINGASSNSGVITLSADLAGSNTLTQNANSILNIAGNASITGLTATANPNTVNYNGAAQTIKGTTYDTLQLTGTNTKTGGAVVVNTSLSVIAGVTLSATSLDLSGGAASNTNAGTITLTGNLTGTGGLTQSAGSILTIGGNATITTLDASTNANTVNYNGAAAQTVKAGTYRTLNFSGNSTKTAGGAVTVSTALSVAATSTFSGTTLTINGASFNTGTITLTTDLTGSSSLTQNANAVLNVAGSITITTLDSSTNANTVNYNGAAQTVLAQNYRTLIFGGTNTKTASAGFTVGDSLTVNAGVTFSGTALTLNGATNNNNGTITLTGTLDGTGSLTQGNASVINVAGDLTITTLDASTNANTVNYNGAGAQSVKATTYRTLNFSGGNTKTAGGTVVVSTAMTNPNGTTFSGTTLQIDGASSNSGVITLSADLTGGSTLTQNANSTLNIAGNATITGLTATANPNTVNYNGAAQTVKTTTYDTLTLNGSGTKTAGALVVNTSLSVISGVTLSATSLSLGGAVGSNTNAGAITLTGNLTGAGGLTQSTGGVLTIGGNATITSLDANTNANTVNYNGGGAQTVFVTTYRTLNLSGASTKTAGGTITVNTGMTVAAASTFSGTTLTINGASTNSGIITLSANLNGSAVLTQGNGSTLNIAGNLTGASIDAGTNPNTVNFNNAGAQTIPSTTYQTVLVNGSGTKTLGGNIAVVADLSVNAGTLDLGASTANRTAAGGTFTLAAGTTLLVGGANNFPANYTTNSISLTSTVNYNGAAQTVAAVTYGNLTLSGSNTKTAAGAFTVAGNLSITGVTYSDNGTSTTVNGNIANTGTHIGAGKIVLSGGGAAHALSGTGSYTNLELNDAQGATLSANLTINGGLTLTAGVITTGANNVIIANVVNPSVTRTAGFINGNEQKAFDQAQGANQTFTFDVASDTTNYTPVTISQFNFTGAGTLTGSTTGAAHPSVAGALPNGAGLSKNLNRFWTVTNGGLTVTSYNATFVFVNGDLATCVPANLVVRRFSSSKWFTTSVGTRNLNDTTATGITSFSDFELGEDNNAPAILAGSTRINNLTFDVPISEDVFHNQGPPANGALTPSDFTLTVVTQASAAPPTGVITQAMATIQSVTLQNSPPNQPVYRFVLDYMGNLAAGTETVQINSVAGKVFDSAGNALTGNSGAIALADETPPTVVNVTSLKADGTYTNPNTIVIDVQFSENVFVAGGTPALVINTGAGTTVDAPLTSGTGTTTLHFTYTLAAGNFSTDLDYVALPATQLKLNGATIKDLVGNNADLTTLPDAGTGVVGAGSLSVNKALLVDCAPPTFSTPPVNVSTPEDTPVTITFKVADNITDTVAPGTIAVVGRTSGNTTLIPNANITSNANPDNVTRSITLTPLANANGSSLITITIQDGVGLQAQASFTLTVTPVNDNPAITTSGGAVAYTEGAAAIVIDGAATASDVDSNAAITQDTTISHSFPGTLTVTLDNSESFDILSIGSGGSLTSSVTSGAGTNTISGNLNFAGLAVTSIGTFSTSFTPSATFTDTTPATSTVGNTTITYQPGQLVLTVNFAFGAGVTAAQAYTAAQAVMQNVTYNSISERPFSNPRTATFKLTDGAGGASNTAARNITVTEVNDAPAVSVTIGVAGIPGTSGSPNMAFNDQTVTGFSPINGDNVTLTTSDQIAKVVLPTSGGTPSPVTFTATATDADDALSFTWTFTNTTTNVVSTFSGTGSFGIGNVTAFNTSTPSSTPNTLGNVYTITNTAVVEFTQAGSYTVAVQVSDGRPVGAQSANANVNTATYTHGSNGTEVELTNILNVNTPPRITPGDGVTLDTFVPAQDQPITFTLTTVTTVPPGMIDQDGHTLTYTVDYGDGNIDVFPSSSGSFTSNGNTISFTHTYTVLPPNIQPATDGSVDIPVVVTITDGQTGAVLGTLTINKDVTFSNPIIGAADTVDVFNPEAPSFLGIHSASQKGGGVRFTVVGCSKSGPPTAFVYGIDRTPTKVPTLVKVPPDKQDIIPFNNTGLNLKQGDMYTFGFDFGKRSGGKPGVYVVEVIDADGNKGRKLYAVTQQVIDGTDPATQDVNVAASFITGKLHFDKTKTDLVTFRGRFSFVSTVAKQAAASADAVDLTKYEFVAPSASAPKPLTFVIGIGNLLIQAEANGTKGKVTAVYDYAGTKLSNGEKCSFRFKLPKNATPKYTVRQIPNSKPVTFEAVPITRSPGPDTSGNDYPFGTPIKDFGAVLDLKISLNDASGSGLDTEGVIKTGGTLASSTSKVFDPVDNGLTHAQETSKLTKTDLANIKNIDSAREDSRVIVSAGSQGKVTFYENFRDLKVGTLKPLGVQIVLLIDNGTSQVVFASKIPTGFLVRHGFGQLAGKK